MRHVTKYEWGLVSAQGPDVAPPLDEFGYFLWAIPKCAVCDQYVELKVVDYPL